MNNTRKQTNRQEQKNQQPKTRQGHGTKKQGRNANALHSSLKHDEHEYPETRMTR